MGVARLLVIAGSDSSAGAGIQADLKTAQAFGVYAQTAITAVTVQNTLGVPAVQMIDPEIVRGQIEAALADIGADAIKIGMLGNAAIAAAVADALDGVSLPLVLDPVMVATSGARLLDEAAISTIKTRLIPRAMVVTPNLAEAEALTGIRPVSDATLRDAMRVFAAMGARSVLFKDGHGEGAAVRDVLMGDGGEPAAFVSPRQQTRHTHGTGCTLATAIACGLASGLALSESVARAHAYVQNAIRTAPGLGQGHGPLNHLPPGKS